MALGNVLRGRKQFAECADGVDTIGKPEKSNWVIYYFRGICFEHAKQGCGLMCALKTADGAPDAWTFVGVGEPIDLGHHRLPAAGAALVRSGWLTRLRE